MWEKDVKIWLGVGGRFCEGQDFGMVRDRWDFAELGVGRVSYIGPSMHGSISIIPLTRSICYINYLGHWFLSYL